MVTLSNGADGTVAVLRVRQDTTGGRTLAIASTIERGGRAAPVLNTGANKYDYITFMKRGSTWVYMGIVTDA